MNNERSIKMKSIVDKKEKSMHDEWRKEPCQSPSKGGAESLEPYNMRVIKKPFPITVGP